MKKKRSQRILSVLMAILMVALTVPASVIPVMAEELAALVPYRRPDATVTLIYTAEQLNAIRENLGGTYILMNDIHLSEADNWIPIGSLDAPFTGTLLGAGYTIDGMNVQELPAASSDGYSYAGLFGYSKGYIYDLHLKGNISAPTTGVKAYIGSLVGYNAGRVVNCRDGVAYAGQALSDNRLYTSAPFSGSKVTLAGDNYAVTIGNGTWQTLDGITIEIADSTETSSVYIFLQNVELTNFTLTSTTQTARNVYIISMYGSNVIRARDNNNAINLPNDSLTVLGDSELKIYGENGDNGAAVTAAGASGNAGEDGKAAVAVGSLTVDMTNDAILSIYGGTGGTGGTGANGVGYDPTTMTGKNGGQGGAGGVGGSGGIGALGQRPPEIRRNTRKHLVFM